MFEVLCVKACVCKRRIMWRITEMLVIDGNSVQDFELGHLEVVFLCICNVLRAHHGLGCCCSMDKLWATVQHSTVTQSLAFRIERAISFENDFFSCQRNMQCCQHARGIVMNLSLIHTFDDFPVWKGLGFVYLCVGNSAGEECSSY